MRRIFSIGLAALFAVAVLMTSAPLLAQDNEQTTVTTVAAPTAALPAVAVPATDTVIVSDDQSVVIPYGSWISGAGDLIKNWAVPILLGVAAWVLRQMPAYARVLIGTWLTEQNMRRAIDYAINEVAGAMHNETLTIPVGNKVIAVAAQYFVDSVPAWLTAWLGGPESIPDKVVARIRLEKGADAGTISRVRPVTRKR